MLISWKHLKRKSVRHSALEANEIVRLLFSFYSIENLKVVVTKQEAKVIELEKQNAEMESAKKRAAAELKSLVDRCAKQEQTVTRVD